MMTEDSARIVARFFEALEYLKAQKIETPSGFCSRYGINRRNLYQQQKDPRRMIFQPCWLGYLVNGYGVSSGWLLTGRGRMLSGL